MGMEPMAVLKSIMPFPLFFWFRGFKLVLNSNMLSILSIIWGFSFEDRSNCSSSELDSQQCYTPDFCGLFVIVGSLDFGIKKDRETFWHAFHKNELS